MSRAVLAILRTERNVPAAGPKCAGRLQRGLQAVRAEAYDPRFDADRRPARQTARHRRVVGNPCEPGHCLSNFDHIEPDMLVGNQLKKLLLGNPAADHDHNFNLADAGTRLISHFTLKIAVNPDWYTVDLNLIARTH